MAPQNRAAWQMTAKSERLEIRDAPYPVVRQNEVIVKNHAIAINPIDWILQQIGNKFIFPWLKYPMIFGYDVAGEVVEVGVGVTRFKVGDRVLGMAAGHDEKIGRYEEAGYQLYTVLREHMTTPMPDSLTYEAASVVPLGAATAACGLFQKDQLALELPSINPIPKGKALLVWGGSSSVGSSAIQLATAAGYEVYTTCSPRNFDLVKKLGAVAAFDYNVKTVVSELITALQGKEVVGALSIGDGAVDACFDVLCGCKGNKFIAVATKSSLPDAGDRFPTLKIINNYISFHSSLWFKSTTRGTKHNLIFADTLVHDGIGKAIFTDFLPEALAQGKWVVQPSPFVVGEGLESIQTAMEQQKAGVSARKVVVSL